MTDRPEIEQLVRELHAARLEGNLERLCALYADEARLRIGQSNRVHGLCAFDHAARKPPRAAVVGEVHVIALRS